METKTIICQDCGSIFESSILGRNPERCPKCQHEYRLKYFRAQNERRKKAKVPKPRKCTCKSLEIKTIRYLIVYGCLSTLNMDELNRAGYSEKDIPRLMKDNPDSCFPKKGPIGWAERRAA